MKKRIIEWLKNYIYMRFLGGKEAKAAAKMRRAEDKLNAAAAKKIIALKNEAKAEHDLQKTIDEIQSEEEY